jgi:hypothetical protein
MGELLVSLSVPIFRASLFFKHEAYQNEREYRFIQLFSADNAVPDFKFRHQPYRLVRYREFDLAHCCSKFAQENYHWPSRRAG